MKYEWDEETNMLKLDRVLHGAAFYPHDYGFIPQTLCGDGDPLVRRKIESAPLTKAMLLVAGSLLGTFFAAALGVTRASRHFDSFQSFASVLFDFCGMNPP